jgi:hypothetical protein
MDTPEVDDMIRHIKTSNLYQTMGPIKVKINGVWIDCIHYASADADRPGDYARPVGDFDGFEIESPL